MWVFNAKSSSLYPWARHEVPIVQEAGWTPGQIWTCEEKRKFLAFTGVQIPNHPSYCVSLYQLHYPSHTVSLDLFNFPLFYKDLFFMLLSFFIFFFLVDKEFIRLIQQKSTLHIFLVLNRKYDIFTMWMRRNIFLRVDFHIQGYS